MYHIKNDKRAYRSAELISQGLIKCINEKDFIDITVSDVQRASGVGRATFYRLFDNISDVLAYECDLVLNKLNELSNDELGDAKKSFMAHIDNWMNHEDILLAIFKSKRIDILFNSYQNHALSVKEKIYPDIILDETKYDYFCTLLTTMIFSILAKWMMRGKKESSEELYELLSGLPNLLGKRKE